MAKRTLVLMRHAKSSWDNDLDDIDRPLSDRGVRDAAAAGRELLQRGLIVDVALVSPAVRAQLTWQGVESAGVEAGAVRTVNDVYFRGAQEIVDAVREVDSHARTVIVIGHAPTIPDFVELVAERSTTTDWYALDAKFPTAGLAVVDLDCEWDEVGDQLGTLRAFVVPRG